MVAPRYRVEFAKPSIRRDLRRIPKRDHDRIAARLLLLAQNPRPPGIKAIEPGIYRMRVGNYRVIYKVEDDHRIVVIGFIGPRNEDTYARLRHLF